MKQPVLFFGFPVDERYGAALANVDPKIYHLFVDNNANSTYLQLINYRDQQYLGKHLGALIECGTLELLQANIYSLLRKLVPEYSYEEVPLRLLSFIPSEADEQS
jgi:hypothetical protein